MKNYHTQIQKILNQIEVLNKKCRKLSLEKSRYRMKLEKEKAKEKRNKYKQTRKEINNLTLRIGSLYEEKAISIESDEERLPLLLKALEYYEKSNYYESLKVLKTIKNISSSIGNNKLVKLCDTKKLYIEAEMLNNNAELLWYTCLRLAEKGQIDEKDKKWAKLNLLRGKIIRKLNKGLKYTIELDNPYLEIDFLTSLTWNLYRRINRHKFRKKIKNYHKRAAQIYESIAMKNINSNPELSIENFKKALGQNG